MVFSMPWLNGFGRVLTREEKLLGKIVVQARGGSVGDAAAIAKTARRVMIGECMVDELNCMAKFQMRRGEEKIWKAGKRSGLEIWKLEMGESESKYMASHEDFFETQQTEWFTVDWTASFTRIPREGIG